MLKLVSYWLVAIAVLVGFTGVVERYYPVSPYNSVKSRLLHPTDTRVRYRIGAIDPRFGLDREAVKQVVDEAVAIWHTGINKPLFVYDDKATLTIQLIYDERQEQTLAKQRFEDSLNPIIADHSTEADRLTQQQLLLERLHQAIEQDIQAVNSQAHHSTDDRLNAQRLIINAKIREYEQLQADYNADVAAYNAQSNTINELVTQANARFVGREFHKGEFDGKHIRVYEFKDMNELRLVLAHELGHALGLDHSDEPKSLMYPFAGEQDFANFHLHSADIALFDKQHHH